MFFNFNFSNVRPEGQKTCAMINTYT
jgi:hypothetical protein